MRHIEGQAEKYRSLDVGEHHTIIPSIALQKHTKAHEGLRLSLLQNEVTLKFFFFYRMSNTSVRNPFKKFQKIEKNQM